MGRGRKVVSWKANSRVLKPKVETRIDPAKGLEKGSDSKKIEKNPTAGDPRDEF